MHSSYPKNLGNRLLAIAGAAMLCVGAFALPAAAQTTEPAVEETESPSESEGAVEETTEADAEDGLDSPFLYDKAQFRADPGSTTELKPAYLQTEALPAGTVALAYGATEPFYLLTGVAEANAPYENCVDGFWTGDPGFTCIVTDIEDLPGATFAPDAPISYTVGETTPGPLELCGCNFEVRALDAAALEAEYGDVDTDSGDQLGLEVVSQGDDPLHFDSKGYIDIISTDNPYDLAVSDTNVKGDKGDEVTLTVPVKNLGPASAVSIYDGPGTYALIGILPEGLDLVKVGSDGDEVDCLEPGDPTVEDMFPQVDPATTDFVCFFSGIEANASFDFEFTVTITDPGSNAKGTLAVVSVDWDYYDYPNVADANEGDNLAGITVDGPGGLPTTGASLGLVIAVAGLVLAAGVVLLALTARRRKAAGAAAE